jgi:hypothetical protein|nr:MAG TPA: hypothetical protein [Caudoviricetes sp.]
MSGKVFKMAQTRAERAKQLRYKRGIAAGFTIVDIQAELMDISSCCSDIKWIAEGDEDTLIAALDGNEEEAYEFRMMFSDLESDCERLTYMLSEEYVCKCFDDFFCRVAGGSVKMLGYDSYEEDYFTLCSYEGGLAQEEAEKRLSRLTKQELLRAAEQCFGIAAAFLNLRYRYDYLKATFDILRDENSSYLETIKGIEEAYEKAAEQDFNDSSKDSRYFDRLIAELPPRAWLD